VDPIQLAAILAGTIVLASVVSVEVGLSVALIELGLGVVVGNLFNLDPNVDWLVFTATFASIVLTFLAGAEVDPTIFVNGLPRRYRSDWSRSSGRSLSRG